MGYLFKDIAELIYGKDIITQTDLSICDKLLNVIGLDAVKAMKKITQIAQVAMIIDVAKIVDVKVINSMADTVKLAKMKATGLISKTKMTSNLAKGMGDDLVDIVEEGVSRSKVKMNIQLFAEGKSKLNVPGRVQSRINVSNDGWEHILDRHYSTKNASQFTIDADELKTFLNSNEAAKNNPVIGYLNSDEGIRYVREIDMGYNVGLDKFNKFEPTSIMTVLTDEYGNLVTATPGYINGVIK